MMKIKFLNSFELHYVVNGQYKVWFFPWKIWRLASAKIDDWGEEFCAAEWRDQSPLRSSDAKKNANRIHFVDYDGEKIVARVVTYVERRALGEGRWSFLSWFWPSKLVRYADVRFESEVGQGKGSYKGGVVGVTPPIPLKANWEETVAAIMRHFEGSRDLGKLKVEAF